MAYVPKPKTVVAVTGTNGKTTVSNLTTGILRACGYSVTNNSLGSNIQPGVATALLQDSTIFGKAKKDIAILECDERSAIRIFPHLNRPLLPLQPMRHSQMPTVTSLMLELQN
jgi:UDP-N-acetylmuramyl pentapeptide synthase